MIGCQDFCQIVVFASLSAPSVSIFGCFNLCSEHLCVFSCSTVNLTNLADQILPISNEACSSYLHWAVAVHIGSNIWISLGWLFSNYHKKRKWKVLDVVFPGPRNKLVWGEQSINLSSAKQLTRLVFMFNINTSPSATTPPILPESPQLCSSSFVFRPIFALVVINV